MDFLTKQERELLEDVIMEQQLETNESNGGNCIAHYCVSNHLVNLRFEAVIEDDGSCIDLRTPYDEREERFVIYRIAPPIGGEVQPDAEFL